MSLQQLHSNSGLEISPTGYRFKFPEESPFFIGKVPMAVLGRKPRWLVEKFGIVKKLARRGCFAVYVGEERERHEIPVKYLNSRIMQALFNRCRDQLDKHKGLYLFCSPELLNWVLELAKAEVEETDHNLAIKNHGIINADTHPMRSFSNYIVVVQDSVLVLPLD